jgi:ribose transport system permease protein
MAVVLVVANVIVQPAFAQPRYIGPNLTLVAPLALAAVASTPAILTGGIDVSIGPLMGLVNVLAVITWLPPEVDSPPVLLAALLAVGTGVGLVNGILVAVLRLQPVVATIGTYLILAGLNVRLLPVPQGPAPDWISDFAGPIGPVPGAIILMAIPVVIWLALRRLPWYQTLMAVGGDEVAAWSAGVATVRVKLAAYALGGVFAAVAGIALTALLDSADAGIGPTYTLIAIAAVALGGTSLAGGRGGLIGAFLGGAVIFLIQNLLTAMGLSSLWLPLVYGTILLVGLILGTRLTRAGGPRGQRL